MFVVFTGMINLYLCACLRTLQDNYVSEFCLKVASFRVGG